MAARPFVRRAPDPAGVAQVARKAYGSYLTALKGAETMNAYTALHPIRRILVGHKLSDRGTAPIEMAIAIARTLGARVRVVRVQSSNPLLDRLGLENFIYSRQGRLEPGLSAGEMADSFGLPSERLEIVNREGRARAALLEEASRWSAD